MEFLNSNPEPLFSTTPYERIISPRSIPRGSDTADLRDRKDEAGGVARNALLRWFGLFGGGRTRVKKQQQTSGDKEEDESGEAGGWVKV